MTLLLLLGWGTLTPLQSAAQTCTGTLSSTTFDTVYTSTNTTPGNAGNNTSYNYRLPQFPLSATSTLYAVSIRSTVSVTASVDVKNNGTNPVNPTVKLFRNDDINSSASGDINATYLPIPSYSFPTLAVGASETRGALSPINNYNLVTDSVNTLDGSDLNGYIGSDSVDITYSSSTTPVPSAPVIVTSTTVTETMHFTITYYFCNPGPLGTEFVTFTAVRKNNQTAALNWINSNEQAGREYTTEVSSDGNSFSAFASQPSDPVNGNAHYLQGYTISPTDKGKLYFRIKLVDANGLVTYSPMRIIDLGAGEVSGFSIYPNPPSDYLNLLFPPAVQGWQVEIIAADGSLMQRNYYNNTNSGRLNFQHKLSAGTYFARATDMQTAKSYVSPFVIRY